MTAEPRIAINAQLRPGGGFGGVEQFTAGLVRALGRLDDGPETYVIVGPHDDPEWLEPLLGANQVLVRGPQPQAPASGAGRLVLAARRRLADAAGRDAVVPRSHGFYEGLGAHLVHFPFQSYVRCRVPTVFSPHDVQHLHLPEFFSRAQIAWRERVYRLACREAVAITVESRHAHDDLVRCYRVPPAKVTVIRLAPSTSLLDGTAPVEAPAHADLPEEFALYPAQTWPHKNHVRLLEALALLRERDGSGLGLVCTGRTTEHFPEIRRRLAKLDLESRVRFLGWVDPAELRALYRACSFVVLPSLFEGAGIPVLDAFAEGAPLACSGAASLSEYAGDAALVFDPTSVEAIMDALRRLHRDQALRRTLVARGRQRAEAYSWERTAREHREVYRAVLRTPR